MTHNIISLSAFAKNHTGERFGMLVAISPVGKRNRLILWLCKCDCGGESIVISNSLTSGNTCSCGCMNSKGHTTHGLAKIPEYKPWTTMKYRCENPNNSSYHKYGARGIKVCERWHDFSLFMEDMGSKPTPAHSIERVDNDGNYCPDNCKWALPYEQARNTRQNHWITYKGKTMCITDWAKKLGMVTKTLSSRVGRLGWSIEKAIETPVHPRMKV